MVHDLLRRGDRDPETLAEPVGLHAVGEAVGDGLGLFALLVADVLWSDAKDRARDGAVHVLVRGEGGEQTGVLAEMREDAQFDLVVVRHAERPPGTRHEGVAQAAPLLGSHRDVVQIRVLRREPTSARHGLAELGVDLAVGTDRVDEGLSVGAA